MARIEAWRPALRMAARDIRRYRARSLLVALLVGLPVMLSAVAATTIATDDESVAESLPARLGQAQAAVMPNGAPVKQNPDASYVSYGDESGDVPPDLDQVEARLADLTGGTLVQVKRSTSRVVIGRRGWDVDVVRTDLSSPLTRGIVVIGSGRAAVAPDEVVVTPALADDGAAIGDRLVVGGTELRVVGTGTVGSVGSDPGRRAVAVPESSPIPEPFPERSLLIDREAPITWDDVQRLNEAGFVVLSRAVVLDPPPSSQVDMDVSYRDPAVRQLIAIVVTALVIEVVLLAGPAFAVSVRRQRRELATVAAVGGASRDLRRIVMAQALVLGVSSSLAAAALSVPAAWLTTQFAGRFLRSGLGPFDVQWIAVMSAAALGIVASLAAAWVPARQAARSDVVASLAGRAPAPRPSAGWPLLGALLVAIGFAGIVTQRSEVGIATLTIVTVIGAVLLVPALIGLVARTAGRLPLPLRLAVRDSDRQRARSAPAIAAIMASVSAVTALAVASSSDAREAELGTTYSAPIGAVTVTASPATMSAAIAAAEKASTASFTPLPIVRDEDGEQRVSAMVPDERYEGSAINYPVAVADSTVLAGWGVTISPAQQAFLDGGGALVPDVSMIVGGSIALDYLAPGADVTSAIDLPARAADLGVGAVPRGPEPPVAGAVVSRATADRLALPVTVSEARSDRRASQMDVAAVRQAVIAAAPEAGDVTVEKTYRSTYAAVFAILAVLGALAIALGTFSATGLALSDARRDLATLVAVGASPRTRRLVAASQALVLSMIGAALGIVIGLVPGLAAARNLTGFDGDQTVVDVPWSLLGILLVAVPLVVSGVTALVSRGRPWDAGGELA